MDRNTIYDKELEKYQCKVWLRLIFDSMKDIDNRTIRKEIIAHPYECDHPMCVQMSNIMRGIKDAARNQ